MQSHAIPPVVLSPAMARRLDATAKAPASSDAASPRSFQDVLSLSTQARNVVENDEKTDGVPLSDMKPDGELSLSEEETGVMRLSDMEPDELLYYSEEGPDPKEETGVMPLSDIKPQGELHLSEEGPDPA